MIGLPVQYECAQCYHAWRPRKREPMRCPRCGVRLDWRTHHKQSEAIQRLGIIESLGTR